MTSRVRDGTGSAGRHFVKAVPAPPRAGFWAYPGLSLSDGTGISPGRPGEPRPMTCVGADSPTCSRLTQPATPRERAPRTEAGWEEDRGARRGGDKVENHMRVVSAMAPYQRHQLQRDRGFVWCGTLDGRSPFRTAIRVQHSVGRRICTPFVLSRRFLSMRGSQVSKVNTSVSSHSATIRQSYGPLWNSVSSVVRASTAMGSGSGRTEHRCTSAQLM